MIKALKFPSTILRTIKEKFQDAYDAMITYVPPDYMRLIVRELGADPHFVRAVAITESADKWMASGGRPVVRFETHVFRRYTNRVVRGSGWNSYQAAAKIDKEAASLSTSFGKFQIMGFNHRQAGHIELKDFVNAMWSPYGQAMAFINFIKNDSKLAALIKKGNRGNFREFGRIYNGGKDYWRHLERNYRRAKRQSR